jgi:parallel beta-helix repeat protein
MKKREITITFLLGILIINSIKLVNFENDQSNILAPNSSVSEWLIGNAQVDAYFSGSGKTGLSWADAYIIENKTFEIFEIDDSDRYIIFRNVTITSTTQRAQIDLDNSTNIMIDNSRFNCNFSSNFIRRSMFWARVNRTPNFIIKNSTFISTFLGGVFVRDDNASTNGFLDVRSNTFDQTLYSLTTVDVQNTLIKGNNMLDMITEGISVEGNNNTINSNTVIGANTDGIKVMGSNSTIDGNLIQFCGNDGIEINGSDYTNVTNNNISSSNYGIRILSSDFVNASNNEIRN